jgi:hypothetical protein
MGKGQVENLAELVEIDSKELYKLAKRKRYESYTEKEGDVIFNLCEDIEANCKIIKKSRELA